MAKKEAKAAKPAKAEKPEKKEETATDKMWRLLGQEWRVGATAAELRKAGCADPDKSAAEINAQLGKAVDKKKEVLKFKDGDEDRYMFKHYFDKYAPARFKGGKKKEPAESVARKAKKEPAKAADLPEPKTGKAKGEKPTFFEDEQEKPAAKGKQVDDGFDEPAAEDMDEKPSDPKPAKDGKAEGKDEFDF